MPGQDHETLLAKLKDRSAVVGVIGLGYVGLPLAVTAAERGLRTIGLDIDPQKMDLLNSATSYIEAVAEPTLRAVIDCGRFSWTTDFSHIRKCDVIAICVPTPLNRHREPDLSFVEQTARDIAEHLKPATLVSLESTTFPGTTKEVLIPLLQQSGLTNGEDFFTAFSPEREDPGNKHFETATIPKIVAGDGDHATKLACTFYEIVVDKVVPVSSTQTAEAVKITENVFRAVNIALVNELKIIYDAMGIDVWEVIDGAATKPFGYMPFYPGPGLGGHCIPIDPFYLSWKAREYDLPARFIELAGEINVRMPTYVVEKTRDLLDNTYGKGLNSSSILVCGISYKKNVPDMRESPAVRLVELFIERGASVEFYDPHVPNIPKMRKHPQLYGMSSINFFDISKMNFDVMVIATDHDTVDYEALVALGRPIVDTRNAISRRGLPMDNVAKA